MKITWMKNSLLLLALVLSMLIISNCAGKRIEGTQITDDEETTRDVLKEAGLKFIEHEIVQIGRAHV